MNSSPRALRILIYSVWAVLMTALTYIFGGVSLKVMRRKFGRAPYWGVTLALSAVFFAAKAPMLGLAFFSLVALIGVFAEFEEMGFGLRVSALLTMVINTLVACGAFAFWVYSTGPKWSQAVLTQLEAVFRPLSEMNAGVQINYFQLMLVLPSVILIMWLGALYVAVLLEGRLTSLEGAGETPSRSELRELRMPDPVVWIFILALLGTFGGFVGPKVEAVAANVLNVCFVLFFFQGLAVVSRFFERMRMSPFWQTLFMALVVVYLFLFVSILGLSDYWFDFRSRLAKRTEEFNREV